MPRPSNPLHQRTNPVEVIYGALPALLYFNASFARDLLRPLLEFQSSPRNQNPYAASDLGRHPNAEHYICIDVFSGDSYPYVFGNTNNDQSLAIESMCLRCCYTSLKKLTLSYRQWKYAHYGLCPCGQVR